MVITNYFPNESIALGEITAKVENTSTGEITTVKDEISFTAPAATGSNAAKIVIPAEGDQTLKVNRNPATENAIKAQSIASLATEEEKQQLTQPDKVVEKQTAIVERVFEGGPSGTTFVGAPLTIKSPAPAGVPTNETLDMALLTSNDNGTTWKAAPVDMGSAKCVNGQMIVEVNHFSLFAPGFVMGINKINSKDISTTNESTKYSDMISKSGTVTLKTTVETGMIFVKEDGKSLGLTSYTDEVMAATIFASLSNSTTTKVYLWKKLLDKIKADNNNVYPKGETFATKSENLKTTVLQNTTIDKMVLTTTYIVKVYSIKVGDKVFKIGVKTVNTTSIDTKYKSGHGHGHGDDMNAGGGIINFQ